MIRVTAKDGTKVLLDFLDIRFIKQEFETDHAYNTTKEYTLVVFRDGTNMKVLDSVEKIDDAINVQTIDTTSGTWP